MGGVRGRAWLPLRFPRVKDSSDKASGVADSGPASGSARAQSGAPVETKLGPQSWNELAETLKEVLTRLGPAAVLGFIAATLPPLGSIALFYYMNDLGAWLRGHGTQGLVYYALGFGLFAGLALLPTYASAALGGWAFGFANGFPAAMSGFVLGSLIGYAIARPTASSRVESLINEKPKWKTVRDSLVGSGFWRTLMIVTLVRVPPNSPFAVTNLVLASVRVPVVPYALGTLLGMAPRTAVVLWVASHLQGQMAKDALKQTPWWLIAAGIVLSLTVLGVLGLIGNRALARVTKAEKKERQVENLSHEIQ